MVSRRIEPVLDQFYQSLTSVCASMPSISFLVAPPM